MRAFSLFLIFVSVLFVDTLKSQSLSIGATANIGLSQINRLSDYPIPEYYEYDFSLSGNAGLFIRKELSRKSSVGLEVLWVQITGEEAVINRPIVTSSGDNRGFETEITTRNISYLGAPIYYRLKINNLGIKVGVQPMLYLFQKVNRKSNGEIDGESYAFDGEYDDIRYNNLDYGLKAGLDYSLNDRFRLRADYYHGFKSIIPYWIARSMKIRQVTLGVEYDIYRR